MGVLLSQFSFIAPFPYYGSLSIAHAHARARAEVWKTGNIGFVQKKLTQVKHQFQ